MSTASTGVWAYAITEQDRLDRPDGEVDLSWLSGVGEAAVRTITCSGLTALASDVSLAEFGEAPLRDNLENLAWLDEVARLHHYVVDAAARLVPLLPVRLATVYSGDAAVRAALADHRADLRDALHRVGGRVEWGVKAYATAGEDEAARVPAARVPAEVPAETPAGGAANGGPRGGAGLAYLKRRRGQLAAGREARAAAVLGAQTLHTELAGKAAAAMIRPPQSAQLSGIRQPMLLNAAYLLDAGEGPDFTTAVATEATAHPELRIELTGPWPPYSFTGDDHDGH
ncbi:MAG TPA: GvpL/GvpF family gas vesicle protein [Trebonia sp.]|nr:GvpL/GvpF family gas vesicle protein [Trebonia sp.]